MATKSRKPETPKPDPLAAERVKIQAPSNLEKAYLNALFDALFAADTKDALLQKEGGGWIDGEWIDAETLIDAFFAEWQKVERDRIAAVLKLSDLVRDLGIFETKNAHGRGYYRTKVFANGGPARTSAETLTGR